MNKPKCSSHLLCLILIVPGQTCATCVDQTYVFVLAGETTVGRTDDQDVTIADPSVSGSHAVIDVVELPGGGGKRLTLKVRFGPSSRNGQASDKDGAPNGLT